MDKEDINIFINSLNLKLNFFSFDFLAPIPLSFIDLGVVNRVSDKKFRSLNLPDGYGKPLKDLLKPVQEKGIKRKLNTACTDTCKPSDKFLKTDTQQNNIAGTSHAKGERKETSEQQYPTRLEHVEEESVLECENDEVDFNDLRLKEAVEHLNEFLDKNNLDRLKEVLKTSRDEVELKVGFGIHLISKLAGEAYTSKNKNVPFCPCGCQDKLSNYENMWIGSESTWFGELDILAGNPAKGDTVSVTVNGDTEILEDEMEMDDQASFEDSEEDETVEERSESPGTGINVEEKCIGSCDELNQVIAQAVTFAFTEYNRHKTKGNCIPSVLIDKEGFQYVIYSPADDILLLSNRMNYDSEENFEARTGFRPFVVLWIILNHRLFFKKSLDFRRRFVKSGFHEKMDNLQHFQSLLEYSENVSVKQNLHFVNDTPHTIGITAMNWFLFDRTGSF